MTGRIGAVRTEIMALPAAERLPWALEMLEELLGDSSPLVPALIEAGHTPMAARLANALSMAAPRWVARDALLEVVNRDLGADSNIISAVVLRLRRGGVPVKRIVGYYRLEKPLQVELRPPMVLLRTERWPGPMKPGNPARHAASWSAEEDADLREMVRGGWTLWAMADELERRERGVEWRMQVLGLKK